MTSQPPPSTAHHVAPATTTTSLPTTAIPAIADTRLSAQLKHDSAKPVYASDPTVANQPSGHRNHQRPWAWHLTRHHEPSERLRTVDLDQAVIDTDDLSPLLVAELVLTGLER